MPVLVPMNMSFLNYCGLFLIPGWDEVLGLPVPERMAKLRDPETQQWMLERAAAPEAGVFKRLADFANYVIGDTYSAANEGLKGRVVADIAAERGQDPFATLVDIVVADDLRTILWPIPPDGDDASWELRQQVWDDPRAMLGGSDAGAHLDRMCGAPVHDPLPRRHAPGPQARPARAGGADDHRRAGAAVRAARPWPAGRGLTPTSSCSIPATIGSEHATLVHDLPGGSARLTADSTGRRARAGSTASRPSSTARPPAPSRARSSAAAATPRRSPPADPLNSTQ